VIPSSAYVNSERAKLNKLALSVQFVEDEWKRRTQDTTQRITTIEEFYRDMIHGQE
jgi:hypothetical protein